MKKLIIFLLAIIIASTLPQKTNAQEQTIKIKVGEELILFEGNYGERIFSINMNEYKNCYIPFNSKIKVVDLTSKDVVIKILSVPPGRSGPPTQYDNYDCSPCYSCLEGAHYIINKSDYKYIKGWVLKQKIYMEKQDRIDAKQRKIDDADKKIIDKYRDK